PPGLEQDVGDADMADRQVALQRSVGRGGGGEPLDDGEALAIGSERLLGTAGCRQCERDLVVAGRQPALPRSHSVLRAIASLGRALQRTIVAEGVETLEELAYLQAATRIRFAQGYYFSKPFFLHEAGRAKHVNVAGRLAAAAREPDDRRGARSSRGG